MNSETIPRRFDQDTLFKAVPQRNFGRYRPIAVLGHGGMATVYLATAQGPAGFTKLVVAKELRPELAGDPEFRSMFLDEARLAARLHHPNIVQTFEVLDEDVQLVIVMEYLDGQPMNRVRQRMAGGDPQATGAMLRIVADMLGGLHFAHELADYDGTALRVVHRDVSPHNVFVTYTGEAKLVDFGVAKVADASARTQQGVIKGKLSYMAPEQALGLAVDRRADIFAAGVMLWEIVAGKRIWKGIEDVIMGRLQTGNIPSLREARPDAPEGLVAVVERAIAPLPSDRYPTAARFQAELEEYLASLPDAPTARQAGSLVSEAFTSERAHMRDVIEEQMGRLRGQNSAAIPVLNTRQDLSSPTGKADISRTAVTTTESFNKNTSLSKKALSEESTSTLRPTRTLAWASVGLVAAALIGGGVSIATLTLWRSPADGAASASGAAPAASTPAPVAAASSAAPAASVEPKQATLRITTSPKKAVITFDDQPLQGNPADVVFPAGSAAHKLSISAPGYVPSVSTVVLDRDQSVEVKLKPRAGGGPRPTSGEPDLGF
jgi:eukaryotic-like serine/threonine-protein kinase